MKRVSRPSRALSSAKKHQSTKPSNAKRSGKTGQIRIIGGQWRGRKLPVLNADGLRPTTDRNKETLFNWLMSYINRARCIDVFAGSGGLGLEALSRYAAHCDFIEVDKQACSQLKANLKQLKLEGNTSAHVHNADALSVLKSLPKSSYDIVFVDPPFGKGLVEPALEALKPFVTPGSVIYVEHESDTPTPLLPNGWHIVKEKRTSALCYMLIEVS